MSWQNKWQVNCFLLAVSTLRKRKQSQHPQRADLSTSTLSVGINVVLPGGHLLGLITCLMSYFQGYFNYILLLKKKGLPGDATGKEPTCQCRRHKTCGFNPWVAKTPGGKGMETHSSILTQRIPCSEEPGRLQSIGSQRVKHDWNDLASTEKEKSTFSLSLSI